ncbi:class F sortase [Modestobacter lapidis]|nr:class F sortase [Modestobacter lapidis]
MTDRSRTRPSPRVWAVLAGVLALLGLVAVLVAVTGQQRAPQPAAATAERPEPSTPADPSPPGRSSAPGPGVEDPVTGQAAEPVAAPVSVSVPSIGVTSDLLRLGLNDDGTVEVPPLEPDDRAGWYEPGPAPGAVGPAVILGHVDSAEHGPGIFFDLGALQPGDEVSVTRADGTVAVFAVDRVERHPKEEFPTIDVYGNTDDAQLRLITCGGDFDSAVRSYEDNVIAFATLVGTRPA